MSSVKDKVMVEQKRLNVSFPVNVYEDLEKLARSRGKSMTEVLRDAIALEKWMDAAQKEGARVMIHQQDQVRELLIR